MKRVQVHTAHKSFKNVCEEGLAGSFSHCSLYSPPGNLVESQNKLSLPPPAPKPPHSHEKTEDQSFLFGFVDPRHSEAWEGDDILQLGRD